MCNAASSSAADEREVERLLEPLIQLLDQFRDFSRTHQRQRSSEFTHRLARLQTAAINEASVLVDPAARESVKRRSDVLIERFREART